MSERAPPPALRERILAEARRRPSPTRARVARTKRVLFLLTLAPAVALLAWLGLGPHGRPPALVALLALGWLGLAAAGTLGLSSARSPLGPPRPRLLRLALALPPLALALVGAAALLFPDTWSGGVGPREHAACLTVALAIGGAPLGAALGHLRGSDPVGPSTTGAALGATLAAWAGFGGALFCPHGALVHGALGHALPVALLALVGAALGRWALAVRT